jgi:hypothetical protein
MEMLNYWRKSYSVKAICISKNNIEDVADALGGKVLTYEGTTQAFGVASNYGRADLGDWYITIANLNQILSPEQFMKRYWTHAEQTSEDEKYAKIFNLVMSALSHRDQATRFNDDIGGMDLLAIQTTKKIMEQF